MPSLRWIVTTLLVGLIGAVVFFFAGAVAHKKCVYPFCQGFVNGQKNAPSTFERVKGVVGDQVQKNWKESRTHLYDIEVDRILLDTEGRYGAVDTLGMDLIVVDNDGRLFRVEASGSQVQLPTSIPVDSDAFLDAMTDARELPPDWFGVKDILVTPGESPETFNLFAMYQHWNEKDVCATLRVGHAVLRHDDEQACGLAVAADWRPIYETTPCIPLKEKREAGQVSTGFSTFSVPLYGGRIVPTSGTSVLVSFGDPGVEDYCADSSVPCSFARMMQVDYETGESAVYSKGHRNPQGLHVAKDGRVWSTEHASRGGDELNWIRNGEDYGWPHVSYGTDYGSLTYARAESEGSVSGSHEGYTRPVYAWSPGGIGISQLTSISSSGSFPKWNGDLLVGSLSGQSLFRMRIREDRAVLVERIRLRTRVRDIAERPDGTIAIKTDGPYLLVVRPALPDVPNEEGAALAVRDE